MGKEGLLLTGDIGDKEIQFFALACDRVVWEQQIDEWLLTGLMKVG
jgi:hypothetical protein